MAKVVEKRPYFGLQFTELAKTQPDVNASFTWSKGEKAYLRGKLSFDRHKGSYKYPNEVVLSVWSKEPPEIAERAFNNGYYRIEIPIPESVFLRMVEEAATALFQLRIKE